MPCAGRGFRIVPYGSPKSCTDMPVPSSKRAPRLGPTERAERLRAGDRYPFHRPWTRMPVSSLCLTAARAAESRTRSAKPEQRSAPRARRAETVPWDRGASKRSATTAATRRRGIRCAAPQYRTIDPPLGPYGTGAVTPSGTPPGFLSPQGPHTPLRTRCSTVSRTTGGRSGTGRGPAPPTALRPARFRIDRSDRDDDPRPDPASRNGAASCPWGQTGRPDDAPKHGGGRTSSPSGPGGKDHRGKAAGTVAAVPAQPTLPFGHPTPQGRQRSDSLVARGDSRGTSGFKIGNPTPEHPRNPADPRSGPIDFRRTSSAQEPRLPSFGPDRIKSYTYEKLDVNPTSVLPDRLRRQKTFPAIRGRAPGPRPRPCPAFAVQSPPHRGAREADLPAVHGSD